MEGNFILSSLGKGCSSSFGHVLLVSSPLFFISAFVLSIFCFVEIAWHTSCGRNKVWLQLVILTAGHRVVDKEDSKAAPCNIAETISVCVILEVQQVEISACIYRPLHTNPKLSHLHPALPVCLCITQFFDNSNC